KGVSGVRIVLVVLAIVTWALIVSGWMLRDAYSRTPAPEPVALPACGETWTVLPGDRLWAVASRCYPEEHTGAMVLAIRAANPDVDPGRLRVGQRLVLPERGR